MKLDLYPSAPTFAYDLHHRQKLCIEQINGQSVREMLHLGIGDITNVAKICEEPEGA